jgi:crotonobetainyl-CoA:carnitine CoA-transferase CaiB-like acyl-CoA transferase
MVMLGDVHVVDFGHYVAGPFASRILAEFGADVVKIEPIGGDTLRPSRTNYYPAANAGKRSVQMNIKAPAATELIRSILDWADVVHHNFRHGVSDRLGLDATTLRAIKPELIVLESQSYGDGGPKVKRPGIDVIFQGYCGHCHALSGANNPPVDAMPFSNVDCGTGRLGAIAIMAALYRKRRTGEGASLKVSLLEFGLYTFSELLRESGELKRGRPLNSSQTGMHPAECLYQVSDGWVAVAAPTWQVGQALLRALGIDTPSAEYGAWSEREYLAIAEAVRGRSTAQLAELLAGTGVHLEACNANGRTRLLNDPRLRERGMVVDTRDSKYGRIQSVGLVVTYPGNRARRPNYLPASGADTREFLSGSLGLSSAHIDKLYADNVVA